MFFQNKIKFAVDVAGGPTYVATKLGCSGAAVHAMIRKGRVSNIDKAKKLSAMSGVALLEIRPC